MLKLATKYFFYIELFSDTFLVNLRPNFPQYLLVSLQILPPAETKGKGHEKFLESLFLRVFPVEIYDGCIGFLLS